MVATDGRPGVVAYLSHLKTVIDALRIDEIDRVIQALFAAVTDDRQVFIVGNGGSAATASHMACDLAKVRSGTRRLRALALTDNVALITAHGNDLGYQQIFAEQLRSLANPGDVLVVISASGNSPNILEAVETARTLGVQTVGLIGFGGGAVQSMLDHHVLVMSDGYGPVEDIHMVLNHVITSTLSAMLSSSGT
jgi:D-sedoheptulose 7-phosphate isomerase